MTEAHRYVRSVAPTLILVPDALINTWITEVEKHFGDSLTLIIFFDSNTGDRRRKLVELQKPLDKLDLTVRPPTTTETVLSPGGLARQQTALVGFRDPSFPLETAG
ncbi:hypothetical protein PENARI_c008G02999 [Penicillium arizonense]|uniref:Uncharacterized protein n=1 Tax=Penicillium arizonense TaxID=1835702 RepID=A0A1F5LIS9_PENAI|nr:hypothetical protein PENARI_c008G02999 [Penicillium arizonense]OGE53118.1 hypothetical protein PENARI_c008G02999 [Penicillium arizonense]